jgi:hypothetical protein
MSAYENTKSEWMKKHSDATKEEIAAFKDGYMAAVIVVLNKQR